MKSKTLTSVGTRSLTAFVGFSRCAICPGPRTSALQRSDQRLFAPECDRQRQPVGDARSMVDGRQSGTGKGGLRGGHDDVRLWEDRRRAPSDPTQPLVNPHTHHIRLTNAKISWDMTGCPAYMPPATTDGLSVKRHGQA